MLGVSARVNALMLALKLGAFPILAVCASPLSAQIPKAQLRVRAVEGPQREEDVQQRMEDERDYFGPMASGYLPFKLKLGMDVAHRWGRTFSRMGRLKGLATAQSSPTWLNLGPFTTSQINNLYDEDAGRPSAVLAHPTNPDIFYMAVSGGGVFRCTNATSSGIWNWQAITDGLPAGTATGTISIGALVMDPTNPNHLYLGLGDGASAFADQPAADGIGLYTSQDGGNTWTLLGNWIQTGNNTTRILQILCLDANTLFVGGNDGLWKSSDAGSTWNRINVGTGSSSYVWSIAKLSATELVLGLTDKNDLNGAIYYTSDTGATWIKASTTGVPTFDRVTVRTSPSSSTTAYAIAEDDATGNFLTGVLKSTDKGQTWTLVNGTTAPNRLFTDYAAWNSNDSGDGGQAFYNHCLVVDPDDANRLFVGSNLALWRSMDGGSSWQQLTHWYAGTRVYAHADWHAASVYANAGAKTYYFGNDGGLCILRDPWRTTIPTGAPGNTAGVSKDITFIDNTKNVGIASHLVYNLGSTLASNASDARYRISLGLQDNGSRIRTDEGTGLKASGQFDDQVGGDGFGTLWSPSDANMVLATIYNTEIYRSTDGGATFTKSILGIGTEKSPFHTILTQDASDPTGNTVYTASNTKVYRSRDFGATWTALSNPYTSATTTNRGIAVASTNANNLCVLTTNSVNLTQDGGSTWTNVASSIPQSSGRYSYAWYDSTNEHTLYLASAALVHTSNHLWKSIDGGTTWRAIDGASSGFPTGGLAHVIKNAPGSANTLYVGTDYGLFQSLDGGSTWARFGVGLPAVRVSDIYLAPDNSFIRVATFGRGVWELLLQTVTGPTVTLGITTINVTPLASANFTATVQNFKTDNTVNWTVSAGGGSVNPTSTASGVATTYTAPATAGLYTVTAASNESPSATTSAKVAVFDPAAVTVTVSPATKTVIVGATFTFNATVANAPDGTVTWSATGGTITSGGVYTAPATAGTYTVTATSSWTSATGTATVTVKTRDLNGDGTVDQLDLLYFAKYYGTANATCDLNGDGVVDDSDLALLLGGL